MFNISSLLAKFKNKINALELNNQEVLDIVEKITQIKLSLNDVDIKNNVIFIKSGGAVKNKIFIFKNKILDEINKNIPIKIVDIR